MRPSRRAPSLLESFNHAFEGIIHVLRTQRNMRLHFLIATAVLIAALAFDVSRVELIVLLLSIAFVLIAEMVNSAIEAGFSRAWNSIFDSNVSSLITAFILFWFGTSVIRGFALVLIIGVSISMFTAITVSRTVLRFVVTRDWARRPWLYGISEQEFMAARPTGRPARGEARSRV